MRYIELYNGIRSSALAFGCSSVLGAKDAKTSRSAIDAALAEGINHFDLARSYGYGEAEKFVGSVLKNRRKELVLATKFGIKANWKAQLLNPVKPIIRSLKESNKSQAPVMPKPVVKSADKFHSRININPDTMIKSLETSLKALQTDYIDYFFVHEPHQSIAAFDQLLEAANKLKQAGKIRAFGVAFMRHQYNLHKDYIKAVDMWQFDCSPGAYFYEEWLHRRSYFNNILFSPLTGGNPDLKPKDKLINLQKDFPTSVIISAMFNPEHIAQNAQLFK